MSEATKDFDNVQNRIESVKPDAIINQDGSTAWEQSNPIVIPDYEYDGKKSFAIDVTELMKEYVRGHETRQLNF